MPRLLPGRFLCAFLLVGVLSGVAGAQGSPILIEFFFEPGCSECGRVKAEILPELKLRYEGFYDFREYDIGIPDNYLRLAAYQERLGISGNASVSMILDSREVLNGFEAIADGLFPLIDRLSQEHLSGSGTSVLPPFAAAPLPAPDLESRFNAFTMLGVVTAGLIDGINPCAISTLVFFMSLLAALKVSGRRLVTVGVAFCLASFLTYTGIGFGLFRALHLFSGFTSVRAVVNAVMIVMLLVFAAFSFKDAWKYHRSHSAHDVSLQLPEGIKLRIHKIMRGGLGTRSLFVGSLLIGSSVTVLESVCTGQVYIPTLVMLIKGGGTGIGPYLYLILYNLLFIVPIVTVFILTLQGLKTPRLLEWSRRNVVFSKALLGLFFVGMAALILVL